MNYSLSGRRPGATRPWRTAWLPGRGRRCVEALGTRDSCHQTACCDADRAYLAPYRSTRAGIAIPCDLWSAVTGVVHSGEILYAALLQAWYTGSLRHRVLNPVPLGGL